MAAYNRQQITALYEHCEVEVISPIPWTAHLKHRLKQPNREKNGIIVHHPTYYYTPRVLREWYGDFFYYSIVHVAKQLLDKKPFDIIFSSWLYPDSWAAAKLARRYNLPLYVKVHGSDVNSLIPGTTITRKSLEVVFQAKKVICVSKALKERLIELGVPEKKLEVLYNGVDHSIFYSMNREDVRLQLAVTIDEIVILYVGNLKKEKGLDELITSFKIVSESVNKPSRLVIIGSGAYGSTAQQLVSSLNITGNVQFLGSLPLKTIALWMNAASVLCLPSYMEGVPNVVLEALSCGTRVVATRVGGVPELAKDDGMLTLVPPSDISALSKAILSVVINNSCGLLISFVTAWETNAQKLFSLFRDHP